MGCGSMIPSGIDGIVHLSSSAKPSKSVDPPKSIASLPMDSTARSTVGTRPRR